MKDDLAGKIWRVGIHIADLSEIVTKGGALDKCAMERVQSKYIGRSFFKAMLPKNIYGSVGSLEAKDSSPKHAMSLFIYMN